MLIRILLPSLGFLSILQQSNLIPLSGELLETERETESWLPQQHNRGMSNISLKMCSKNYVLRTFDVVGDVTRSKRKTNIEIAMTRSVFIV